MTYSGYVSHVINFTQLSVGSGPAPEEVLMALRILDTEKVSLKSGFDKYLSTDEHGKVQGRSDAIGVREQWEPIFQDVRNSYVAFYLYFISCVT